MPELSTITAQPPIFIAPLENEPLQFIVEDMIPLGSVVLSITSITATPGSLSFSNAQPNAAAFREFPNGKGKLVPIGKAILAQPAGQVTDTDYLVDIVFVITGPYTRRAVWDVRCRST